MAATIPYYTVDDLDRFPPDGNRYELLDGVLLVTPAPSYFHELVVSRIVRHLIAAVPTTLGVVFTRGAVSIPPKTQLEPDVLVLPAEKPASDKWHDVKEHWLAVEVLSRSSHVYDREFKRNAYLALGVREVWLVDRSSRSVEVSRIPGVSQAVRDILSWRVPTVDVEVQIDLNEVFAEIE